MAQSVLLKFIILVIFTPVFSSNLTDIVNVEVYSKVDLRNQLAHVKHGILFVNNGPGVLRAYTHIVEEPDLYLIEFLNEQNTRLSYTETKLAPNFTRFEVFLDVEVASNTQYKLFSKITYANKIRPAYKQRKVREDQLMRFETNILFFSPYETAALRCDFLIKNESLVEVTKIPTLRLNYEIRFVVRDVRKYSIDKVAIIFVNNDPFLVVKKLKRTIDVNHFGKISVEDKVQIQNNGAKLVGPYSPLEDEKASTDWLYTHLPASATNIQFFDVLGNNSQTQIYGFVNYITLKFRTRYPLFGGWKSDYILQYQLPSYEYLFASESYYYLKIRAIDYVLDDKMIENAIVKIVLPEGARLGKLHIPEKLVVAGEELSGLGGLTVFGRKTLILNGTHLFEDYITSVEVEYSLNNLYFLRAPFVLSVYIELMFLGVVCARRIL